MSTTLPKQPTTGRVEARAPRLSASALDPTELVPVLDQHGRRHELPAAVEHALTIKVDGDELVTLMTIGSQPELLVLGYLRNQGLVRSLDEVASVEVDWAREVAEVKTRDGAGVRAPVKVTAPPALGGPGAVYRGDIYRVVDVVSSYNSVYRRAGSVHGCGLWDDGEMLCFYEDVGRHNATDAIAGWMWLHDVAGSGKILYSTGRLTTEIVSKAAFMGLAVVISRNGVTQRAVELAREVGVMLVARARRQSFQVFSCQDRLILGNRE